MNKANQYPQLQLMPRARCMRKVPEGRCAAPALDGVLQGHNYLVLGGELPALCGSGKLLCLPRGTLWAGYAGQQRPGAR